MLNKNKLFFSACQRHRRRLDPERVLQQLADQRERPDGPASHHLVGLRERPPKAVAAALHLQPAGVYADHSRERRRTRCRRAETTAS
jgi:hypothetical protein